MKFVSSSSQYVLTSIAAVALFLAGVLFTPSDLSTARSSFVITIEHTDDGGKATCEEGCKWKKLTWECSGEDSCTVQLDQSGVSSAPSEN